MNRWFITAASLLVLLVAGRASADEAAPAADHCGGAIARRVVRDSVPASDHCGGAIARRTVRDAVPAPSHCDGPLLRSVIRDGTAPVRAGT